VRQVLFRFWVLLSFLKLEVFQANFTERNEQMTDDMSIILTQSSNDVEN
jgi:hypothetical protein